MWNSIACSAPNPVDVLSTGVELYDPLVENDTACLKQEKDEQRDQGASDLFRTEHYSIADDSDFREHDATSDSMRSDDTGSASSMTSFALTSSGTRSGWICCFLHV